MCHVLHIEDSKASRLIVPQVFEKRGVKADIKQVGTLLEGLEQLETCYWDAILLDLMLPDSSGVGTLRRIKDMCDGIPVVVVSDLDDIETKLECIRAGAVYFCGKREVSCLPDMMLQAIELQTANNRCRLLLDAYLKADREHRTSIESMGVLVDKWAAEAMERTKPARDAATKAMKSLEEALVRAGG